MAKLINFKRYNSTYRYINLGDGETRTIFDTFG